MPIPPIGERCEKKDTIRFYTDNLLSKWGFEDGDLLCDRLNSYPSLERRCELLWSVVESLVIPKIDQKVEVMRLITCHNPIRADKIDGKEINHYTDNGIKLTPEYVDVPISEIIKL